jgi:hypothetical protein
MEFSFLVQIKTGHTVDRVAHPTQHSEAANAKWKYEVFIGKECNRNSLQQVRCLRMTQWGRNM